MRQVYTPHADHYVPRQNDSRGVIVNGHAGTLCKGQTMNNHHIRSELFKQQPQLVNAPQLHKPCLIFIQTLLLPELPLPLRTPHEQTTHNPRSNSQSTDNSHTHDTLLGDLVVNQAPQTLRLQIVHFQIQQ